MKKTAILALGTNLGDRNKNLCDALTAIDNLIGTSIIKKSNVYETEPWGYTAQENFLNMCISIETELSPRALLGACLGIEATLGRVREFKNGPRIIDIDLLLFEGFSSDDAELTMPHPRMRERDFVLLPLGDVLDDGEFFGDKYTDDIDRARNH